ncbi:hypothetical protein PMAYCL1PPCAC_27888, partial [Pristionchus mayeri]
QSKHKSNPGKKLFPCSMCFKKFVSQEYLNKHITYHTDKKVLKCPHCDQFFRTISARYDHVQFAHLMQSTEESGPLPGENVFS